MKIISLVAENVKRLVAVEITPDGNLVQVTGKNGQGKTSVLDAIWWALAGASHIQSAPIRKGTDRARIRLDLGELIITRTFARKGDGSEYISTISVENADGARFPSPQKVIDSLLGELTFDPLDFARAEPKKQFETLRRFVPGVDFDAIDRAHKADFDRRTEIKRFAKEARAAATMVIVPSNTPKEAIDESALVEQLQQAGEHNAQLEQRKARREKVADQIDEKRRAHDAAKARCDELLKEIQRIRDEGIRAGMEADELQGKLNEAEPLPDPIDVSTVRGKIEEARTINANVTKLLQKVKHEHLAITYEQESKDLTEKMENRQAAKRAAIAEAKMPIKGIEFGEGIVLLNGVPFDQASDAEQLRASVAIAAAMNPKLRVIRVRDGSLLDDDGMKLLAEIADQNDMQIWVEKVDSTGKVGFVLEDGMIKQADAPATEAAA
jgi:DNA repair exonuclease SbcCD ATPase subunit